MKNKKGFTLVELLVAIVLVISITVIAIISVTNISKKNKEQAYELVKEQVENAAEEYFNNNEYLFEGLTDKAVGYISVGRLVEEGLLNSVVDPRSGEKINECSLVKVTKEDGKFNINFDDIIDNDNCDNNKYIVAVNSDSENYVTPTISVVPDGTPGNSNWYTSINDVKITVTIDEKLSVSSIVRKHNNTETTISNFNSFVYSDKDYYKNDGVYENVNYIVTDSKGNSTDTLFAIKKDGTNPTVELRRSYDDIEFELEASDDTSKIVGYAFNTNSSSNNISWIDVSKKSSINYNIDVAASDTATKYYLHVKDEAGNVNTASKDSYKYCDATEELYASKAEVGKDDGEYAKIYKWGENVTNTCGGTGDLANRQYYVFEEIICSCKVDKQLYKEDKKHNCGYIMLSDRNITEETAHKKFSKSGLDTSSYSGYADSYYSYIQYKDEEACRKNSNTGVTKICQKEDYDYSSSNNNKVSYHGYQWYKTYNASASEFSSGYWYHNGGNYDDKVYDSLIFTEEYEIKLACKKACANKYNE